MQPFTRPKLTLANKIARGLWRCVWLALFRPSPILAHGWRRFLLRMFGARIASSAVIYPSARVWAPWNLIMDHGSCLSHFVDCYSVDVVSLERGATVSQYTHLCTASHDYTQRDMPLVRAPIRLGPQAWVTACVFVGPGVEIGEGAVIGASSAVFRDVAPWTVVAGNPARFIKNRERPR